ncbi:hypothetical protein A6A08_21185 [Nocardiopsis sp. TSRI0078]|uniref:hypothetical protein n=1 Tax=unclassified Nocardiopsis TaxID=2649073 RepID=UPI00093B96A1|nr:hypothetical protein [Nocardiopsis sp. TSRI0078]OKI21310.1 hypothetical protein A6A08_21185 [Nocardiopsis sp. TSRI0078]
MADRNKPGQCAPVIICPECTEEVRNIPPTDWSPSYQRPDYSHQDGSALCLTYGDIPGQSTGGIQTLRPVVFVPLGALTSA